MNHNFADFELTKLLGTNPYHNKENGYYWSIPIGGNDKSPVFLLGKNESSITAWTWEDIRLYLKDKGFIINIHYWGNNHEDYAIRLPYTISIYRNELIVEEQYPDYSNTYEEGRKLAIEYCLNLIKQS